VKVLFIGGTGNISTSVSKLCVKRGIDLYLLNRGNTKVVIPGAKIIKADITQIKETASVLQNHKWDAVVNWIAFNTDDIQRDHDLFKGKTKQYIFISSASAYQKPVSHPIITESTPLKNPYWKYSQNKIACEEMLNTLYRNEDFPITIVRPSYTYDTVIPVAIGGFREYTLIDRMKKGQKIIVHGDGTSLWTNTHADDFAIGFTGLIGHQQAIGHSFHITSDEMLTWDQIYSAVANAAGVEPNIVHIPSDFLAGFNENLRGELLGDKSYSVIFDNTKIKMFVPEYNAIIPFSEGIKRTLSWFGEDSSRQIVKNETNQWMDKIISLYEKIY
jgi:nucleoside-diphosphate-sugar epimerase